MRRIALFDPLYELGRKKQTDKDGKPIDFSGLGLLTLLFFFEQKMMRNHRAGVKELAFFLKQAAHKEIHADQEMFEEFARTIIQTFRPASGKKREFRFFNWETRQEEIVSYSILKAHNFDVQTNTQFYTLDEDGLELVFATKEFYSEFQLSIHQLVLRKQLEKGEFKGALRQINEMRIDVETLQERMVRLEHEIKRNIISEETFQRYKAMLEDSYYRLTRENEEFGELHSFLQETKERLYYQDHARKEPDTYELVLKIAKELESVHMEHTELLKQSIALKNTALEAAQQSLYYIGVDSFNFDQDITSRIISSPLPLEAMKGILMPFLHVQETKQWSLLTVFAGQKIVEDGKEPANKSFLEVGDDTKQHAFYQLQQKNFAKITQLLLQCATKHHSLELADFIRFLQEKGFEYLLHQRSFYDFWILLHQRSPIYRNKSEADDFHTQLLDGVLDLLGTRALTVSETSTVLHVTERYSIQNMQIVLGENEDDI
jgi:ACT domain-containing protein